MTLLPWPSKGSPRPEVRGPNAAEALLGQIETFIAQAPLNAEYLALLKVLATGANAVIAEIDPHGQNQVQRLATINAAVAKGAAGIPDLLAYDNDDPPHPDDTRNLARWEAVQLGYEPPGAPTHTPITT